MDSREPREDHELAASVREIINEHAEYMNGFDRGQINFGRDAVVRMVQAALRRPSPVAESTPTDATAVEAAIRLAYGLLWHMSIDRADPNLRLASDARKALLETLSKDEQADGIARAKAADGRFTGAA